MPLKTPDTRAIAQVLIEANRWAVNGFEVKTPQDGTPDQISIYCEAWHEIDGARVTVTPLGLVELRGPAAIGALLADAAARFEAARLTATDPAVALYQALRDAMTAVAVAAGRFPADAEPEPLEPGLAVQMSAIAPITPVVS